MSFKEKYRQDQEKIVPNEYLLDEIKEKLRYKKKQSIKNMYLKRSGYAFIGALILVYIFSQSTDFTITQINSDQEVVENHDEAIGDTSGDEFVDFETCRVPMLIVNGRVYYESSSRLTSDEANGLRENYLGVTESLFDYLQHDGTSEGEVDLHTLKGMIGPEAGLEVYTLKEYDATIRLFTFHENDFVNTLQIWESFDGLEVENGGTILEQLKVNDRIKSISWDSFDNWNQDILNPKQLEINSAVQAFIESLNTSIPYIVDETLRNQFYTTDELMSKTHKFIYIELIDGTDITFRLTRDGYFSFLPGYSLNYVFKVEEATLQKFWELMK
ncbi:MAG TPA: hypothetical protein DCY20_06515 [Firmicutes bacterium]|nr:hypothetical protein [Bacillota bacterium]